MDVKILILLMIFRQKVTASISISDEISEDITFLHKNFSAPPSKRAIIEVDVSCPIVSTGTQTISPVMGIYTTEDHINIKKQCVHTKYGQLKNSNLHRPIRLDESELKPPKCLEQPRGTVHCRGTIIVQDFKPRNFSFSFGFKCPWITPVTSLKGLVYNLTIHGQTNEKNCVSFNSKVKKQCSQYFQHGLLPNLIGSQDMLTVSSQWDVFTIYVNFFEICYQHSSELGCHFIVPECDSESKQVIHPCREMCHDFMKACSKITFRVGIKARHISSDVKVRTYGDCDYLPTLNGDIPCFYKSVSCELPTGIKNAIIIANNSEKKDTYSVFDTLEYSCDEGFSFKGNNTVTCTYNGQWSAAPKCSPTPINKSKLLSVILPLFLIVLLIMLLIAACKYRIKMRIKNKSFTRNKQFDAFVCYCYEGQDPDFAEKIIPQNLEHNHGFRLCVHRRDFKAGWDIKWNIINTIRNSNSTIIIMSQDYINSLWCVEEFEDCYMENMKDPAFKLFVVLMQPADTLNITNEYMNSFLTKKTYLERDDPKLFKRIAEYLFQVKQPKDGKSSPEITPDEANDVLLMQIDHQDRVYAVEQIIMGEDKKNIKLRKLNTEIGSNMESVDSGDDEIGDKLLERNGNHEGKETIVEVHSGDSGDTI